ncbi:MAG: FdtA/QdtA family cupin domain-containing protein [Clostridia bacterium]|nr:FdtA/QdtA family cupin domain-containing protein [Clostridia bacterium]
MDTQIIQFQNHADDRGSLIVAEYEKEIPFLVKRIYYIYDVSDDKHRGFHSHKDLLQVYIAIHGSLKVMLDDGKKQETVLLDNPAKGLYIGHNVWREIFDFSKDAVLLVLASEKFSESDYIRKYNDFLESIKKTIPNT